MAIFASPEAAIPACKIQFLIPMSDLTEGQDSSFFLGSAKQFLNEPFGVPNLRWQKSFSEGLYRVFLGPMTLLVATSPAALIAVTGKGNVCEKPAQVREGLSTTIGHGLVTAEGEEHKRQRKVLNPVFRGERGVRTMVPGFWTKAMRMQAEMDEVVPESGDTVVDISKAMMRVAFGIIMQTVFGIDIEKDPHREERLLKAWEAALLHGEKQNLLEAFCEGVLPLFVSPKYTDWLLRHTKRNQRSIKGRQILRSSVLAQIRQSKEDFASGSKKADLVQMMLSGGMSDELEMQGQLMTMLSAGHETTAAALTWGLYALAADSAVQSRLREEIKHNLPEEEELTAETMDTLQYLHGFVMEVLRLYPSIMQTVRETTEDTLIDGTMVPRGQMILVPIYAINRSPQFWGEHAEQLDPERWSNMSTSGGTAAAPSIEGNVTFQHSSLPRDSQTWYKAVGDLSDQSKVPLVILHGGPGAGHNYLTNLDTLTTVHGTPTIFYDQIGNGLSTHFPEYRLNGTFWTTDLFVAELENLLSHLGLGEDKPYDILGQSWGGMLASSFATTKPKGLRKLVISSSPASMSLWSEACSSWIDEMPQKSQDAIDVGEREQNYTSDAYQEAVLEFYKLHLCRTWPGPDFLQASLEWLGKDDTVYMTMNGPSEFTVTGNLKDWDIRSELHKIDVPTLILNGEFDEAQDSCVKPYSELIKNSTWHTFPGLSHMSHIEDLDAYLEVLRPFLTTSRGSSSPSSSISASATAGGASSGATAGSSADQVRVGVGFMGGVVAAGAAFAL
ncbi:L-amino acid amidase [Cyphellophora attinorum]|uniref:L-amino acid amidase n=1 Tax=Cyphellophora attinorum TaxID=1664694 RepID=A0A0N1GZB1_9EURO|nr:L-amino acid amidase [Phialophora attinorum]KPI36326.1 L-amino acid amidase [Phialophora attinorum]